MANLESIKDCDSLRQIAALLEKNVINLQKENAKLRLQIARLTGQDVSPQMELELLKEQIEAMQHQVFGPSSEKRPSQAAEDAEGAAEEAPKPRPGHGPRTQPALSVQTVLIEMPEQERRCPICGDIVPPWEGQHEEAEQITVVGVSYKIEQVLRQKYCGCDCGSSVLTAPAPDKLIPGGRYSVDFAIHVAEQKYLDHMPLDRQVRAMARSGLIVDTQTLWDQLEALASHLEPCYLAIREHVLAHSLVHADETQWPLLGVKNRKTTKWWIWCVACDDAVAYLFHPSRSLQAARQLLEGYDGILIADGYKPYQDLRSELAARDGPKISIAFCWAHVRRKLINAQRAYPDLATQAVDLIAELYAVEKQASFLSPDASAAELEPRLKLRQDLRDTVSREILGKIWEWSFEALPKVLPKSSLGKAISYMHNLWDGLKLFLDDPRIPLDNNAAERVLRGIVVGRKNHYGSKSERGTEVAAILYTLLESAKLAGVDPRAYLKLAASRAIQSPGTATLPAALK